jgi:peptidoglycan/LPS O-acetylase OafA/YrhL
MRVAVEGRSSPGGGASGSRLAGLDLLRLAAALAVVAFHYLYAGPIRDSVPVVFPEASDAARYGFLGVQLFFVISGFVIAASVEGRSAWQFTVARAARLYPAHAVCMTLTAAIVAVWGAGVYQASVTQWAANLTMVAPAFGQPFMDGAYWSIVVEITFYGWVAMLLWLGVLERRLLTILAVWLALSAVNEAVLGSKVVRLLAISEHAPLFASGIVLHRMWGGDRRVVVWLIGAVAVLLGGLHGQSAMAYFDAVYADRLSPTVLWVLHCGIYVVFVLALLASRRLVAGPVVLGLGGLTYPFYLLHQHAGHTLIGHLEPIAGRWPALLIVVGGMLAVSWLVWKLAEPVGRRLIMTAAARASGPIESIASRLCGANGAGKGPAAVNMGRTG